MTNTDSIPWIPLAEGRAFKSLRFFTDNRGFVELVRVEPGTKAAWHRHTGEVHATNHTGELVGEGDYVFEPSGNTDWWVAVGDKPLIVHVVVMGAVEYLDQSGEVTARIDGRQKGDPHRTVETIGDVSKRNRLSHKYVLLGARHSAGI
jgi:hypothetical protein